MEPVNVLDPKGLEINIKNKKWHLIFNVRVTNQIQSHYDEYIVDFINNMKHTKTWYEKLAYTYKALLDEEVKMHNEDYPHDKWEEISDIYIQTRFITSYNAEALTRVIVAAFNGQQLVENTDPNAQSVETETKSTTK